MDFYSPDTLSPREADGRVVVALAPCNDVHLMPARGQIEREVAKELAGCGMVGVEVAVQEDDLQGTVGLRLIHSYATRV